METNLPKKTRLAPEADGSSRLEELLRENLALSREILAISRKTKQYMFLSQVFTVVKIVLIVGPLILAIIYLPSLLKEVLRTYNELWGSGSGQAALEGSNFINDLFGI